MLELIDVRSQIDLTDIYITCHPITKEYTFSTPHGTFSKIDQILSNKAKLRIYKIIGVTPVSYRITMG